MSVHYKFKSALSYDTITFDGLHISVRDLKKSILQQKQIGKATDFDLQITNAQSNEVYTDDGALIPKNSSLIVVRIPLTAQQKKAWEKTDTPQGQGKLSANDFLDPLVNRLAKTVDLASVDASEEDKIQAAITQSTLDYDPSNYVRIKGSNQVGDLPPNYRCYKCLQPGHWIKDCKLNSQQDAVEIRKSTGIPRSFMVPVEGPTVPGAMMTPSGQFAVPSIEHEARKEPLRKPLDPELIEKPTIPQDLVCGVCKDLLSDAVMIPCCGNSFCDECIRNVLLESEDHQCPDCKEKDVSPDTLIPNRFLRNSVNNFRNQTGYCRTGPPPRPPKPPPAPAPAPIHLEIPEIKNGEDDLEEVENGDTIEEVEVDSGDVVTIVPEKTKPVLPSPPVVVVVDTAPIPTIGGTGVKPPSMMKVSHHHGGHHHGYRRQPSPPVHIVQGLPIRTIAAHHPRLKQDEPRREKPPPFSRSHHDRSGTPTVDERNLPSEPLPQGYQIPSLAPPPRMVMPINHPPPQTYPQEVHHDRRLTYIFPEVGGYSQQVSSGTGGPYPPGVDDPRHYRSGGGGGGGGGGSGGGGGGPHYRPRLPIYRAHSPPPNGAIQATGVIDNTLEMYKRLIREQDSRNMRFRGRRGRSRSYSRSMSRSSSRGRSRTPRSRSRTRSPPPKRRPTRSRSRSRTFSFSRSSSRSRSPSRSVSRERRSPGRGRSYRSPPPTHRSPPINRYTPPPRYYPQRYQKEEPVRSSASSGYGSGRTGRRPPAREYYSQQEYSRYNERGSYETSKYSSTTGRDRDRNYKQRYEEPAETPRFEDYNVRDLVAKDWERIRDREIEQRERERQYEYSYSSSRRSESRERHSGRKPKQQHHPVDIVETTSREERERVVEENRDRVLVEVKREPSREKSPEKKIKEKKKKKKDDLEKKKKKKEKKVKEKKDIIESVPPPEEVIPEVKDDPKDDLYGGLEVPIDQSVVESYSKVVEPKEVMLAPLPELSKWEKEEEPINQVEEKNTGPSGMEEGRRVTSEVIKRAENAIFKKSSNPIKPIEKKVEKKPPVVERKEASVPLDRRDKEPQPERKEKEQTKREETVEKREKEREPEKREKEHVSERREKEREKEAPKSVALKPEQLDPKAKGKVEKPKTTAGQEKPSPVRISAKERLGAKVEDKVVVKRDLKLSKREIKIEKVPKSVVHKEKRVEPSRERKKTPLDESSFEPDYETSDVEERRAVKKRSPSVEKGAVAKRQKTEGAETEDSSLSSDDSDRKHKKKKKSKKKKNKKKCKRKHDTSSDSDSSSSSSGSDSEKRKKRHKHKSHKKSKKRKKSKK